MAAIGVTARGQNKHAFVHVTIVTGHYLSWSTFVQACSPSSSRAYCIMTLLSNSSAFYVVRPILRVNDQVELFLLVI